MFGKKRKAELHSGLFDGVLRGAGSGQVHKPSAEQFPSIETIAGDPSLAFDVKNDAGKLFLGLVGGRMETDDQGYHSAHDGHLVGLRDDRHFMIVAGSRAGKGRSLLLPILATWPGSVIVIDPKLDLAAETASLRSQRLGQQVQVIDPFEASGPAGEAFRVSGNPLSYRLGSDDDALLDLAMLVADGLVVASNSSEPHWDESARMFIEGVILHVLTWPEYEGRRTLGTVHRLLIHAAEDNEDEEELSTLEKEMCQNKAAAGSVQSAAVAFYDRHEKERASVLSTIRRHLHFLTYPKIKAALNDGPVDLRTLHDTPTSLYIGLPATKLRSCAGLPRLFINLALAAFEANEARRDFQHQAGRYPCLLVMDEFFSLGRMERIEAAAGQVAGFGVKLCPVLQDLSQLKALYPHSWETFAANCGAMSFFGNTDVTTLDFLEKRLGQTQVRTVSQSDVAYNAAINEGSTGMSYSVSNHPLLSVAELARLFNRDDPYCRQLVLSAKHGPLILQRAYYDQHASIRKLFDGNR